MDPFNDKKIVKCLRLFFVEKYCSTIYAQIVKKRAINLLFRKFRNPVYHVSLEIQYKYFWSYLVCNPPPPLPSQTSEIKYFEYI